MLSKEMMEAWKDFPGGKHWDLLKTQVMCEEVCDRSFLLMVSHFTRQFLNDFEHVCVLCFTPQSPVSVSD